MASPILELFGKFSLDSTEFDRGLDKARQDAGGLASFLGGTLKTATGTAVAAFSAVATGVSAIAKQSVGAYSNFEQLWGGVQKLYGNAGMSLEEYAEANGAAVDEIRAQWQNLEASQNNILKQAEAAYMTSGMSVNEYMQTATGFSAALIKSLGGDMEEAARVTDVAMRAMSDNVNTFGSNAENVQNAIMGLSRNNYTMIDNLKLGKQYCVA